MTAIDAVAEERRRMARDLHDGLGQHLVLLGYLVDEVAALAGDGPVSDALLTLRDEIGRATADLRGALMDLHGPQETLSTALAAYAREVGRRSHLRLHLRLDERGPRWPAEVEREVLRVAQEAIANVHQHARAINVWVRLTTDAHQLLLVVEDDGIGHVAPREGHFGLSGMGERAERIGADLEIGPRRDGGTLVRLHAVRARTALTPEGDGDDRPCVARR